ncbi:MAG TPA: hypothetical protein VEO53_16155, partial [Candidatus Binatia bacterium]|nr:hypothetical protein [Candidatus Binatia bacterium]
MSFAAEALQSLLIVRQSLGQELEGDEAIEARVLCFIHHPHAAAKLFENPVVVSFARNGRPQAKSFPRKRESRPRAIGNAPATDWIPAFAGM